jgi:hypothetical protein
VVLSLIAVRHRFITTRRKSTGLDALASPRSTAVRSIFGASTAADPQRRQISGTVRGA